MNVEDQKNEEKRKYRSKNHGRSWKWWTLFIIWHVVLMIGIALMFTRWEMFDITLPSVELTKDQIAHILLTIQISLVAVLVLLLIIRADKILKKMG